MQLARERSRREAGRVALARAPEVEHDGAFSGYASLFGAVDLGRDVIERGAFAKSLKARGADGVRMLFQHDPGQPIGVWDELHEDHRGLFVRGRLNMGVTRAREVLALLRGRALDGLSIGFRTVRSRRGDGGLRHVTEADLWENFRGDISDAASGAGRERQARAGGENEGGGGGDEFGCEDCEVTIAPVARSDCPAWILGSSPRMTNAR